MIRTRIGRLAALASLALCSTLASAATTLRVYHIGNSVTNTIGYPGVADMAQQDGNTYIYGKHMSPGIRLPMAWKNETYTGQHYTENGFPLYQQALTQYQWDVITLQPYDSLLNGPDGDIEYARRFIEYALPKSPDAQFYIFSRWPRRVEQSGQLKLDYIAKWDRAYTYNGTQWWNLTDEVRAFFVKLTDAMNASFPNLSKHVKMVPVGDVLYELQKRIKAGQVPGYTDVTQLYVDGVHFGNVGEFLVGTTFYATMYKTSPVGLDVPSFYGNINPNLAGIIHDTVWDVVAGHPYSGVPVPEPTMASVLVLVMVPLMRRRG